MHYKFLSYSSSLWDTTPETTKTAFFFTNTTYMSTHGETLGMNALPHMLLTICSITETDNAVGTSV